MLALTCYSSFHYPIWAELSGWENPDIVMSIFWLFIFDGLSSNVQCSYCACSFLRPRHHCIGIDCRKIFFSIWFCSMWIFQWVWFAWRLHMGRRYWAWLAWRPISCGIYINLVPFYSYNYWYIIIRTISHFLGRTQVAILMLFIHEWHFWNYYYFFSNFVMKKYLTLLNCCLMNESK